MRDMRLIALQTSIDGMIAALDGSKGEETMSPQDVKHFLIDVRVGFKRQMDLNNLLVQRLESLEKKTRYI